jgi:hypothetical protein
MTTTTTTSITIEERAATMVGDDLVLSLENTAAVMHTLNVEFGIPYQVARDYIEDALAANRKNHKTACLSE